MNGRKSFGDLNERQQAILYAVLSAALFSVQFPIIKFALAYLHSIQAAILEAAFTILFCLIAGLKQGNPLRVGIKKTFIFGGLANALGLMLLFESLALISPATVGFIGRLYFVYTSVLALIYFKEYPSTLETFAIPGIILGLFLFSFHDFDTAEIMGVAMAGLYPLCFAAQNATIKKAIGSTDRNVVLLHNKIWALLFLGIYGLIRLGPSAVVVMPWSGVGLIFLSTFFATFLGLITFYRAMEGTTFSLANIVKGSEIFFILLFSQLFFPIHLSLVNILGSIIVFFSILVILWEQSRLSIAPSIET